MSHMKETYKLLIIGLVLSLALFSCEKEPEGYNELLITLSNGIVLNQDDIVFYDSADCIFLLKDSISFEYRSGTDPPGIEYVDFSISLDKDTIYRGVVFMGESSLGPSNPTYIACYEPRGYFNSNILDVKYKNNFHGLAYTDARNDDRLISFLKKNDILRNGITVTLESVRLSTENDSSLITTITITNHDIVNYYLPDPNKMGSIKFNFFTGGLEIWQNGYHHPSVKQQNYNTWYDLKLEHLSILKANSKVTYTYNTWYSEPLVKGHCEGRFRFVVLRGFTYVEIPLEQADGWVWVGDQMRWIDNLLIE